MRTTIDAAGRIVIPKKLREQAGLKPGMPLEVRVSNGHVEVEPATVEIRIDERDGFPVAVVANGEMPVLTTETVNRIIDELRRERGLVSTEEGSD